MCAATLKFQHGCAAFLCASSVTATYGYGEARRAANVSPNRMTMSTSRRYFVLSCIVNEKIGDSFIPVAWNDVPKELATAYYDRIYRGKPFGDGVYELVGWDLVKVGNESFFLQAIIDQINTIS
jgi:hypothetical protein